MSVMTASWFLSEVELNSNKVVQIRPSEKNVIEGNTFKSSISKITLI